MGRRSRKRSALGELDGLASEPEVVAAPAAPATRRRKARVAERPDAPWHPVPLTELATFASLVLLVIGFFAKSTPVIVAGFVLLVLFMAELAVREHFAGFRSHTSLLSLMAGIGAIGVLVAVGTSHGVQVIVGAAVFVGAFMVLRRAFRTRAGGLGFRA